MFDKNFIKGAVWHGPWHTGILKGSFGSPDKRHFAMSTGKENILLNADIAIGFFPFTSKQTNKALAVFPAGTFSWGKPFCKSYLLPIKLLATTSDLHQRFKYKNTIQASLVSEIKQNYAKILRARKKR